MSSNTSVEMKSRLNHVARVFEAEPTCVELRLVKAAVVANRLGVLKWITGNPSPSRNPTPSPSLSPRRHTARHCHTNTLPHNPTDKLLHNPAMADNRHRPHHRSPIPNGMLQFCPQSLAQA